MFNTIEKKIKNKELSKNEKKIALYFIENKKKIAFKNSKEIARELNTSDTSVIRFVKSLGFKNFKNFKESVILDASKSLKTPTEKLEKNITLLENKIINSNFISNTQEQINNLFSEKNLETINKIVEILANKNKKYIVGFKSVSGPTSFLGLRLGFLFPQVITCSENNSELIKKIMDIEKDDLLFLTIYPKYSKIYKLLIETAREKKASIVLITDSPSSPYSYQGDLNIFIDPKGISYFNSIIPLQTFFEYILTDLSSKLDKDSKDRLKKINELLEIKLN